MIQIEPKTYSFNASPSKLQNIKDSYASNASKQYLINHNSLCTSSVQNKTFVKNWVKKHSCLIAANDQTQDNLEHKYLNTNKSPDHQSTYYNGKSNLLMHHSHELLKKSEAINIPSFIKHNENDMVLNEHQIQVSEINSLQSVTNFERIAAWVQSVTTEAHNSQTIDKLFQSDFMQYNGLAHLNTKYTIPLSFRPNDQHTKSKKKHKKKHRRGKSVPPEISATFFKPSHTSPNNEVLFTDACDIHLNIVSHIPYSLSSSPICSNKAFFESLHINQIYSRQPDGSSNPHLNNEFQSNLNFEKFLKAKKKDLHHLNPENVQLIDNHIENKLSDFWTCSEKSLKSSYLKFYSINNTESTLQTPSQQVEKSKSNTPLPTLYPQHKKIFSPKLNKILSNVCYKTDSCHFMIHKPQLLSRNCKSHSYCSLTDINNTYKNQCTIQFQKQLNNSNNKDNSNFVDACEKPEVKMGLLQLVLSKKSTKEAGRLKFCKNRLGFLANPLFGKRKEKNFKLVENQGNLMEKICKLSDTRRKNNKKNAPNEHLNQNQTNSNTTKLEYTDYSEIRSGCLRRDKSHLKYSTLEKQSTESGVKHVANVSINCPLNLYGTKHFATVCSIQSSSGHGSECSSTVFNEQAIMWPNKTKSINLKCHCKKHDQHNYYYQYYLNNKKHGHHRLAECTKKGLYYYCPSDKYINLKNKPADNLLYYKNETKVIDNFENQFHKDEYGLLKKINSKESSVISNKSLFKKFETNRISINASGLNLSTTGVRRGGGHASSGYESIMRDSENSSHADSNSGSSVDTFDKKTDSKSTNPTNNNTICQNNQKTKQHNFLKAQSFDKSESRNCLCHKNTSLKKSSVNSFIRNHPLSMLLSVQSSKYNTDINLNVNNPVKQSQITHNALIQLKPDSPDDLPINFNQNGFQPNNIVQMDISQTLSSSSSTSYRCRSAPPCSENTSEETASSPISVRQVIIKDSDSIANSVLSLSVDQDLPKKITVNYLIKYPKTAQLYAEVIKEMERQIRYERIYDILAQQDMLKMELMTTKDRLLIDSSTWNFDLYVAEQMDLDNPSFLEVLVKETEILRKRVDACKSHLMIITCFDSEPSAKN